MSEALLEITAPTPPETVRPARPASTLRALPAWPLYVTFIGFPIWWRLGLGGFIWFFAAVPMAAALCLRGNVRMPKGFGIWALFLLWTVASFVNVHGSGHMMGWAFRFGTLLSGTIVLLYIYNASETLTARKLGIIFSTFWVYVVIGGFLGVLIPHYSFTTPMGSLLPSSIAKNSLVQGMVHPRMSEYNPLSADPTSGRPAAPFTYTNTWGSNFALLMPFVFITLDRLKNSPWRLALMVMIPIALIPAFATLNRGMFLSLGVGMIYAAVRFAFNGHKRALIGVGVFLGVVLTMVSVLHVQDRIQSRVATSHTNDTRTNLYNETWDRTLQSPILGYGTTVKSESAPDGVAIAPNGQTYAVPPIGTQGQVWLIMISTGLPGITFFLGFFLIAAWRTRRYVGPVGLWCHVILVMGLIQFWYYGVTASDLFILMAAVALGAREQDQARRRARAEARAAAAPTANDLAQLAALTAMQEPFGSTAEFRTGYDHEPFLPALAAAPRQEAVQPSTDAGQLPGSPDPQSLDDDEAAERAYQDRELVGVARRGGFSLVGSMLAGVFGFVLVVVVARALSPSNSGIFFEAIAFFLIVSNTCELGADTGLVRAVAQLRALGRIRDIRSTLKIAIIPVTVLSTLAALLTIVLAPELGRWLFNGTTGARGAHFLRVLAPFLPLAALTPLLLGAIRSFGTVRPNVLIESVAKPIARPLFIIIVVALGLGSIWVPLAWVLPTLPGIVVASVILRKKLLRAESRAPAGTPPARAWPGLATEFWSFTAMRGVAAMFEVGVIWADVLIVGAMMSPAAAGVYTASTRFVTTGTLALQALRVAIAPEITAALTHNLKERAENLHRTATAWVVSSSWPLYFLLAVFAPVVLRIFGHHYASGADALTILALAMLVNLATGNVQTVLLMGGRSSWQLANTGVSLFLNITLNLILVPHLGLSGAALAWAASIIVNNVATVIQVRLLLGLRTFSLASVATGLAAAACFGAIGLLLRVTFGASIGTLSVTVLVGGAIYAAILWRFRKPLEFAQLANALPGRRGASSHRSPAVAAH